MELIFGLLGLLALPIIISYFYSRKKTPHHENIREYARILNTAPFPVVITDQSGTKLLMINARASQMLGISSPSSGQNPPVDFIINYDKKDKLLHVLEHQGNVTDFEINLCSRLGKEFWTILSANIITIDEKPAIFMAFTDITEQKELEIVTQKNKELYKSIIRTSPDPIIMVDMLGKIYMISPSAFQLLGYSIKEHYPYGMHLQDFIHLDDLCEIKNDIRQLKAGKNTGPNEYRVLKRDGTIIFIESHSEVIRDQNGKPDSILFIIRDITKRKEAERLIRENEERFTTIFQEVPIPLLIVTHKGRIIDMNRQCEQWFSVDKKKCIWNTLQQIGFIMAEEPDKNLMQYILELPQGEKLETKILLPDRTDRHTIISTKIITISGSPAILILINDIDEIKRAYHAITLANNQLNLLNSITRHDILNKVMIITGYSEILRADIRDEDILNILGNISQSGSDIKNLIEFTKEFQDLGVAQPKWQSVHQIVNKSVIKSILSGIVLNTPDLEMEIFADPMFEKVLYNLMENSKRHGESVSHIGLSYYLNEGECILVYADNGNGIVETDKEKIFQKGFGKNTGLGLFIIREILSITGLSIRECGIPGTGARFEIRIPVGKYRIKQAE